MAPRAEKAKEIEHLDEEKRKSYEVAKQLEGLVRHSKGLDRNKMVESVDMVLKLMESKVEEVSC